MNLKQRLPIPNIPTKSKLKQSYAIKPLTLQQYQPNPYQRSHSPFQQTTQTCKNSQQHMMYQQHWPQTTTNIHKDTVIGIGVVDVSSVNPLEQISSLKKQQLKQIPLLGQQQQRAVSPFSSGQERMPLQHMQMVRSQKQKYFQNLQNTKQFIQHSPINRGGNQLTQVSQVMPKKFNFNPTWRKSDKYTQEKENIVKTTKQLNTKLTVQHSNYHSRLDKLLNCITQQIGNNNNMANKTPIKKKKKQPKHIEQKHLDPSEKLKTLQENIEKVLKHSTKIRMSQAQKRQKKKMFIQKEVEEIELQEDDNTCATLGRNQNGNNELTDKQQQILQDILETKAQETQQQHQQSQSQHREQNNTFDINYLQEQLNNLQKQQQQSKQEHHQILNKISDQSFQFEKQIQHQNSNKNVHQQDYNNNGEEVMIPSFGRETFDNMDDRKSEEMKDAEMKIFTLNTESNNVLIQKQEVQQEDEQQQMQCMQHQQGNFLMTDRAKEDFQQQQQRKKEQQFTFNKRKRNEILVLDEDDQRKNQVDTEQQPQQTNLSANTTLIRPRDIYHFQQTRTF